MITIEERIAKAKERIQQLEQQKRVEQRKEREAKRKKDQRRNYIIGALVTKYFPEVSRFEPGTTAQNAVIFEPLEVFLSTLAADQTLMENLRNKSITKTS